MTAPLNVFPHTCSDCAYWVQDRHKMVERCFGRCTVAEAKAAKGQDCKGPWVHVEGDVEDSYVCTDEAFSCNEWHAY